MRGRPTKYEPKMVDIAKEYIQSCGREATELPTIEGLALRLGVDDERIAEYSAKYPEFHATVKELKGKQKDQLINDGMYGGKEVNSTMAIFLLKANHGLIETERRMLVGEGGGDLTIKVIQDKEQIDEMKGDGNTVSNTELPETAEHI